MDNHVAEAFAALAHETRLRALRRLVQAGCAGATPSWLAHELATSPTALSFHLKALAQAGLVVKRRDGREVRYAADFARMRALIEFLMAECCARPQPDAAPDAAPTDQTATAWETTS